MPRLSVSKPPCRICCPFHFEPATDRVIIDKTRTDRLPLVYVRYLPIDSYTLIRELFDRFGKILGIPTASGMAVHRLCVCWQPPAGGVRLRWVNLYNCIFRNLMGLRG